MIPTEDSASPTHAGGVVYRHHSDRCEFLIVTALQQPDEWVLPKGHRESNEPLETTAVREVREEAGVEARIIRPLKDVVLLIHGEQQRIRFFLMKAGPQRIPREGRRIAWAPKNEALRLLSFSESRTVLEAAGEALRSCGENR